MNDDPAQFIRYREQLMSRLHEVIPVLSQQMLKTYGKRGEQRAALKPEAARILKNLSVELREAALCCIESIARWMLTRQRSSTEPSYMWQGEEYIVKMYTDLDFVVDVLGAYAARIGCFSKQNPLLLTKADLTGVGSRPELARIYGALLILLDVVARHRRRIAAKSEGTTEPTAATSGAATMNGLHDSTSTVGVTPPRCSSPHPNASEIEEEHVQTAPAVVEEDVTAEAELLKPAVPETDGHAVAPRKLNLPLAVPSHRDEIGGNIQAEIAAANDSILEQDAQDPQRARTPSERLEESQNNEAYDFDAEEIADISSEKPPPLPQRPPPVLQRPPGGSVQYEMVRELGRGAFAQVWECDVRGHGRVAVKFLQREEDEDEETVEYVKRAWEQELKLLQQFKHPNIIEFVVAVLHPEHGVGIGCEVADCNLLTVVEGWQAKYAVKFAVLACEALRQIGSALAYVHDRSLIHRDVKPENVLVKAMAPIEQLLAGEAPVLTIPPKLLLCDFGTTRSTDQHPMMHIDAKSTYVGSRWYRAPELLFHAERYTQAVDAWALGTMAVEVMLGSAPFQGAQEDEVMRSMVEMLGIPSGSAADTLRASEWGQGLRSNHAGAQGKLCELVCTSPIGTAIWPVVHGLLSYDFRGRLTPLELVTKMDTMPVSTLARESVVRVNVDQLLRDVLAGQLVRFDKLSMADRNQLLKRVREASDSRVKPVLEVVGDVITAKFETKGKAKALLESRIELGLKMPSEIRRLLMAGHELLELPLATDNAGSESGVVSQLICSLYNMLLHDTSTTSLAEFQSMLQICGIPPHFDGYARMLSASAKSVLLQLLHKSCGFAKFPAVIDRDDVLAGLGPALEGVWVSAQTRTSLPFVQIYPYFKSQHSRKVVDGFRVEEGEGLGPMKEMYQLCGQGLHRVWKQVGLAEVTAPEGASILRVSSEPASLSVGMRLEVENAVDDSTWSVVVLSVMDDGRVRVERPAPADFKAAPTKIFQRERNAFELLPDGGGAALNPRLTGDNPRDALVLRHAGMLIGLALLNRMALGFSPSGSMLERILGLANSAVDQEAHSWATQQCCAGFFSVIHKPSFERLYFAGTNLELLLRGNNPGPDFSFFETFFVNYDQEVARCVPLRDSLRNCLESLSPSDKRVVLKFITAAEQVPAPKTEVSSCMTLVPHDDVHRLNEPFALLQHLYISIGFLALREQERRELVNWLPNSHTCDNNLQIPNYWEGLLAQRGLQPQAELAPEQAQDLRKQLDALLRQKLLQAATMCGTYGLDGISNGSPRRSMPSPDRFQEDNKSQPRNSERTTIGGNSGRTRHFDLSVFDQDMSEAESVVLGSTELDLDVGAGKLAQEQEQQHALSADARDAVLFEQARDKGQQEQDDDQAAQQQDEEERAEEEEDKQEEKEKEKEEEKEKEKEKEEDAEDIEEDEVYDEDFELDEELLED